MLNSCDYIVNSCDCIDIYDPIGGKALNFHSSFFFSLFFGEPITVLIFVVDKRITSNITHIYILNHIGLIFKEKCKIDPCGLGF